VIVPGSLRAQLAAAAVLLGLALAFVLRIQHQMADFEVYWRAGERALAGGALYRAEDGHYQLKYLPAFALAMAPVALLPLAAAKAVWFAGSVASIAILVRLSVTLWPGRESPRLLAAAVVVVMAKFYLHELTLGQTNALMAVLVMLALGGLGIGRDRRAGLLLALAVLVKPYAIAFLPYLAFRRRWASSVWMLAGVGIALVVPAVFYGMAGNRQLLADWIGTLRASTAPTLIGQDNVSVWAMYAKWVGPGAMATALAAGTVAVMAMLVAWIARAGAGPRRREYLEVAAILLTLPLASPQGWDYVLLIATPVVVILTATRAVVPLPVRAMGTAALLVMGLSIFDVMGRRAYASFMAMSWITVCALTLLAVLVFLRKTRLA
jgi:hypothetical protein